MGTGVSKTLARFAIQNYCSKYKITEEDFFNYILKNDYYLNENPNYDTKGLLNPCIVGKYVFRVYTFPSSFTRRSYFLQARLKTIEDTPQTLKASVRTEHTIKLIDEGNDKKYLTIKTKEDS